MRLIDADSLRDEFENDIELGPAPPGAGGLKLESSHKISSTKPRSRPTRGGWIEI